MSRMTTTGTPAPSPVQSAIFLPLDMPGPLTRSIVSYELVDTWPLFSWVTSQKVSPIRLMCPFTLLPSRRTTVTRDAVPVPRFSICVLGAFDALLRLRRRRPCHI